MDFKKLTAFLSSVPAINTDIETGTMADGNWWVQFSIDIEHHLAWRVVQELGCVFNYISVNERLPTIFKPVSPAPYLNGGPDEYLSWIIESTNPEFLPSKAAEWLETRLPQPVDDEDAWDSESADEDEEEDE